MDFIYGLLTAAVFFLCLLLFFYFGYRMGRQQKPTKTEMDERILQKQKEIKDSFIKTMNYDINTALQRKKVK